MRESAGGFKDRLEYAYQVTLSRKPSAKEIERLGRYYDDSMRNLQGSPQTVAALFPNRIEGAPQVDTAAWVQVSRVLLNLDEFITRE
jgi:hypothetical protein